MQVNWASRLLGWSQRGCGQQRILILCGAYPVPALGPFPIASQGRNREKTSHSHPVAAAWQAAGAKPQQAQRESCPKMCLLQAERCQKICDGHWKPLLQLYYLERSGECILLVTPKDKNNPCNPQNISGAVLKTQLITSPLGLLTRGMDRPPLSSETFFTFRNHSSS